MPGKKKTAKKKPVRAKKISRKKPAPAKKPSPRQRPSRRKPAPKKAPAPSKPKEPVIGVVTHYFPKVSAAVTKLKLPLSLGQRVRILGHTTNFEQEISSIQLDHVALAQAKKGAEIGFGVLQRVRRGDTIYKL